MGDKSRIEDILEATKNNAPYNEKARSRIEELLMELKEIISTGGSGSSIQIDSQIDENSENAVMNKAIPPYVNSSIATNTANFIGTFESYDYLTRYDGPVTNNDYAFVIDSDRYGNTVFRRYKWSENEREWLFEYDLNNSSFTAQQWETINSLITEADKNKIDGIETGAVKNYNNLSNKPQINGVELSGNKSLEAIGAASVEEVGKLGVEIRKNKDALVEAVNTGQKNLFHINKKSQISIYPTGSGLTITSNGDDTVIINGTTVNQNNIFCNIMYSGVENNVLEPGKYVILFKEGPISGIGIGIAVNGTRSIQSNKGFKTFEFEIPENSKNNWIRFEFSANTTFNETHVTVMICKKELYDLDPTFTHYAKSNAELTKDISTPPMIDSLGWIRAPMAKMRALGTSSGGSSQWRRVCKISRVSYENSITDYNGNNLEGIQCMIMVSGTNGSLSGNYAIIAIASTMFNGVIQPTMEVVVSGINAVPENVRLVDAGGGDVYFDVLVSSSSRGSIPDSNYYFLGNIELSETTEDSATPVIYDEVEPLATLELRPKN